MTTSKINRVSAPQAIVDYFKARLSEGTLKPGDSLPSERALQKSLGVSRFSLREGLARLSALGIVRIVHGKGAFVCDALKSSTMRDVFLPLGSGRNAKNLKELFEARSLIECEAARLAALRRTDQQSEQLSLILAQTRAAIHDAERFGKSDFDFHRQIAESCGNAFFARMLEALSGHLETFLRTHAKNQASRASALEAHEKIYACIAKAKANEAEAAMKKHLCGCKSNYEKD